MYTIKQVATLAGVTVRTLHYYDEIQLLSPSRVGNNGYRYYDDDALLRLQQILFYREIGFELMQIKDVLDDPKFDQLQALESHRRVLESQMGRLGHLIATIDDTILHVKGEKTMTKKQLFQPFSDEKQKEYEREIRLEYGPDKVNESIKRWGSYSGAEKQAIMNEGSVIYTDLAKAIDRNVPATDAEVQAILVRWHRHIEYFYEPTLEILRGLATTYNTHPDFIANFVQIHPHLPEYLEQGIIHYVDDLETKAIEKLLEQDQHHNRLQD